MREMASVAGVTVLLPKLTFIVLAFIHNLHSVLCHEEQEFPLLLISFDGFRWDYLTRTDTPNFDLFLKKGVTARKGLKNVFVTNTLPNHWSIVTGLYTESHGVLDNFINDSRIDKSFVPKYRDSFYHNDFRYYDDGGEPIWVTNQVQKQTRSGSVMWWGSENPVKWVTPTYHVPYSNNISFEQRIDITVDWLTSEYPINLGLIYFPEPDHTAHLTGPESSNVTEQIRNADRIVGYLLKKLEEKKMLGNINIIVTSDHGFTSVSTERLIYLDSIVSPEDYDILTFSPVASIFPKEGKFNSVYEALLNGSQEKGHFKVYKAADIPERFHYKKSHRVPPIIAVAELGFSFITNMDIADFKTVGNHGYDNEYQEMHPFFVAMGPSFKEGFVVETFETVDIYPLMCHLLHLKAAPNNGSMEVVVELLREVEEENTMWTFGTYILVLITTASVASVFSVAACRQHRYLKRKGRVIQLKLSPAQATIKYSLPGKSGAQVALLADDEEDEEEDDYNDAHDGDSHIQIVSQK